MTALSIQPSQNSFAAESWDRTCVNDALSIEARSIGDFAKAVTIQKTSDGSQSPAVGGFRNPSWQAISLVFESNRCQRDAIFCFARRGEYSLTVWDGEGRLIAVPEAEGVQFFVTYRVHGSFVSEQGIPGIQFVSGEFQSVGDCEID